MSLSKELNTLIDGCKKGKRDYQRKLYNKYSVKLMGICIRYTKSKMEAEDLLQEVFIKIFRQIDKYEGKGSFEGWLGRITVNTAITNYHKTKNEREQSNIEDYSQELVDYEKITDQLATNDLIELINRLPDIYKVVFNLYIIEGYSHKEIAEMLDISEGTSKSQLSRARKQLQEMLLQLEQVNNNKDVV